MLSYMSFVPFFEYWEGLILAKTCSVCGKGVAHGNLVSHSNIKTHRTWGANIQTVRAVVSGRVERVDVCTRCLRSGKVQRAL